MLGILKQLLLPTFYTKGKGLSQCHVCTGSYFDGAGVVVVERCVCVKPPVSKKGLKGKSPIKSDQGIFQSHYDF